MESVWNPWHGCKRISTGCRNCYVYRMDAMIGRDSRIVEKTKAFDYPLHQNRFGEYKLQPSDSPVYVCLTSDFFIEEADPWREEIWAMMAQRSDISFKIITKRIHRMAQCLPADWGEGYDNVTVICTCENQQMTDQRIPLLLSLPLRHREIIHEPMLEPIEIESYLAGGSIERVTCGGESGSEARLCDYDWILHTRAQCLRWNVSFSFHQTGEHFCKNGKTYHIPRKYHHSQAQKAGIDFTALTQLPPDSPSLPCYADSPFNSILLQLSKNPFYGSIAPTQKDREYCRRHSPGQLFHETEEIVRKTLANTAASHVRQWGHPAYTAMNGTACCCRKCLYRFHNIPMNRRLTDTEIHSITSLLMEWLKRKMQFP